MMVGVSNANGKGTKTKAKPSLGRAWTKTNPKTRKKDNRLHRKTEQEAVEYFIFYILIFME